MKMLMICDTCCVVVAANDYDDDKEVKRYFKQDRRGFRPQSLNTLIPESIFIFAALLGFQTTRIVCISTNDIISPRRHVSWNVQALGLFWCGTGCGEPLTEQQSSTLIGHLHRLSSPASVCKRGNPKFGFKERNCDWYETQLLQPTFAFFLR